MRRCASMISLLAMASGCTGRDHRDGPTVELATQKDVATPSVASIEEEDRPADGSRRAGGAMALEEGKAGKPAAFDDGEVSGLLGTQGAGPGGGGTGWGTIGTGAYGTIGHGSGTASGFGVGSGKGGMKSRAAAPSRASLGGMTTSSAEASVRAWFPETFLFEPLVVTDERGEATVPVRVPDRLTTWRVLALAHSRHGAQAGDVTSFVGTLSSYVDLVAPKTLVVGDELRLPIQMVNTTDAPVATQLALEASNAAITARGGTHTIPAQGSSIEYATLRADRAGIASVRAGLGATDAVVRSIQVRPAGRPETVTRTGTLAAPRTLTIEGPSGADPKTDRVRLTVYPGALALLRSELGISTARQGVSDDAYALLLAGRAEKLLASLGDKADPDAIRTLSILAGQRAIRHGRTLDVERATLLTEATLAHPYNPVLARLGERAAAYLAQVQRPDGTFAGETGWTLQRVLVTTAEATRAVTSAELATTDRHRARNVSVRAGRAFERNLAHVQDAYTAAAILASGAVTGEPAAKLRDRVLSAIETADDGSKYIRVPAGVVRADGGVPTRAEATALAILALAGAPNTPVADLGGTLLGSYSPETGWGDGRTNLACMQAVLSLFSTPVPEGVKITLVKDGTPITEGTLDRAALRDTLALEAAAPGLAGSHEWKVIAEPAIPGLGFSLELRGWVPWQKQPTTGGLELTVSPARVAATVGAPVELTLAAIAPSGVSLQLVQSLPAGVEVDTPSLQKLVEDRLIERFQTADGKVEITISPLDPGETFSATYKVIPTLAGTLHSTASSIRAGTTRFFVPPAEWSIR